MSVLDVTLKDIHFYTEDGYCLHGKLYQPQNAKANIVVASATGVPQGFYRRFAEYAMHAGFQVLTFDYRGVGLSAPKHLKNFKMSYLDWGEYDLSAAIDYLSLNKLPIYMVGHSYGGQALGLSSNHSKVEAMFCFGTGAGWHGYMPLGEKIKVQIVWNIVFPPLVAVTGYLPWSKFNMGADLPKDVYQQWRRWCKNPTYFFADPGLDHLVQRFAQVQTPIYAVSALDDAWALPISRQAFMQHYRHAPLHSINLKPQRYGLKQIGHMGYFRQGSEKIWDDVLNQFNELHQLKDTKDHLFKQG